MTENTINVEMEGYSNVADLSVQCLGVLPQSINGHSSTALIKVVYPNEDYEEVFMDMVTKQNHVSHGYKLKLNNVHIATTYVPWRKMFAGSAVLTVEKEVPVSAIKKEEAVPEVKQEERPKVDSDTPMSPVYLSSDGRLLLNSQILQPTILQPTKADANLSKNDTNTSLSNGSTGNNNIGGAILFALGFVAALGIISILKKQ